MMKDLLQENGWLGVAFILTLQFVYTIWKDKNKAKENALSANTEAIKKLSKDLNRYYFGMKILAGERWTEIKEFIETDPSKDRDA